MTTHTKENPDGQVGGFGKTNGNFGKTNRATFDDANIAPNLSRGQVASRTQTSLRPFDGREIPDALTGPRFAPWEAEWNAKRGAHGKWDKIPHNGSYRISTANPEQWGDKETAIAVYRTDPVKFGGIGYLMTGPHGIVGIDLDDCITGDAIAPWAADVVTMVDTYTERSPSGNGLRMFLKGVLPSDWKDKIPDTPGSIEVYGGNGNGVTEKSKARFLTVTGDHLAGTPTDVRPAPGGALDELARMYRKTAVTVSCGPAGAAPELLDDLFLPDTNALPLNQVAKDFLQKGESQNSSGDRSHALFAAACDLASCDLTRDVVFTLLARNEHAMCVAMTHRRGRDKARQFLWEHHACKAVATIEAEQVARLADMPEILGETGARVEIDLPTFRRHDSGQIKAERENLVMAIARSDISGTSIRLDTFRGEIMIASPGTDEWRPFKDTDYTGLIMRLERGANGFKASIPKDLFRDCVYYAADQYSFDSAQHWLNSLRWDGNPRIGDALSTYFGAASTPYTRAVSRYLWTALAGRTLEPGIKADMVPVAVGAQGVGKSTTVAAISPAPDFFGELDLGRKDEDLCRAMRSKMIIEMSELQGLNKRERESIKAFITRTHEDWTPKYIEMNTRYARRCILFGTTNKDEFLQDETGHRRWLPFNAGRCDPARMAADRDQLWAEAREAFLKDGIAWQDAERLARGEHEQYVEQDPWLSAVERWLENAGDLFSYAPTVGTWVTSTDVLTGALCLESKQLTKANTDRMGALLKYMGLKSGRPHVNGKQVRAFLRA